MLLRNIIYKKHVVMQPSKSNKCYKADNSFINDIILKLKKNPPIYGLILKIVNLFQVEFIQIPELSLSLLDCITNENSSCKPPLTPGIVQSIQLRVSKSY